MGGQMWIESEVGEGSAFHFTIPVQTPANLVVEHIDPSPGVAQSPFDSQMGQRHPLSILLVEDNAINQKVALRMLGRLGYQADVANSGSEALAILQRKPYDVVLMDIQMPEMDGVETAQRIRQQWPPQQWPRIVAVTAHALDGDRERYLALGMDDYVSKPLHSEELMDVLYKCVPLTGDSSPTMTTLSPEVNNNRQPSTTWPIDMAFVRETLGPNASQLLDNLLPLFFDNADLLIHELRQAAHERSAENLQQAAHRLKGSSASLGFHDLSVLCQEVEIAGHKGKVEDINETIDRLEAEYRKVKAALIPA
jgi:CheY-like chemotaxis protein